MYRLPTGQATKDANEYFTAWRKLYEFIEKFLGEGAKVIGFDPGIMIGFGENTRAVIDLPVFLCLSLQSRYGSLLKEEESNDGKIETI